MKKKAYLIYAVPILIFLFGCFALASALVGDEKKKKEAWEKTMLEEDLRIMLRDARSYTALKTIDLAIPLYEELLRRYPRNPFLLKEAGDVYAMEKNFTRAKELYDQAVFFRPFDPEMRLAWVRAIENYKKDPKEAIETLKQLVRENPSFVEGRLELADYLGWERQWPEAILVFDEALKEDPGNVAVLFKKGEFLAWSKNYKAAIEIFRRVIALDPNHIQAQEALGRVYMDTNQWEKAAGVYEELYKKYPYDQRVIQSLAEAYFFDERYESAEHIYQSLAQSNPQIERTLSSRLSTLSLYTAPTLTYPFFYYTEKNHALGTRVQSLYHSVEYSHPIFKSFRLLGSIGTRQDDTIHETAFVYGLGWALKFPKKIQHSLRLQWEPWVDSSNTQPRWNLNNVLAWKMTNRLQVEGFHRLTTYWDGNLSNSQGFAFNRFFLEKYDLLMGYRFTVDVIDRPSPYFVPINRSHLHLLTNSFNVEKYWNLSDKLVLTTATSYNVTDLGRNTLNVYGNCNFKLFTKTNLTLGASWSRDNRDIETFSASSYLSHRF